MRPNRKTAAVRAACLFLIALLLLPVLGGCSGKTPEAGTGTVPATGAPTQPATDAATNPATDPESATDTDVTWESDTPEVAVVDEFGFVTAVSGGVATITATTKDGAFTSSAKVYVPSVSESFDNREETTGWGTVVGAGNSNKAAIMKKKKLM